MLARLRNVLLALATVSVLVACSAPTSQAPTDSTNAPDRASEAAAEIRTPMPAPAPVGTAPPTSGPSPVASDKTQVRMPAPLPQPAPRRKPPPEMSDPLPAERVIEAVRLDRSCRSDADCAVKNVGNCCGAFPSCVNRNSPTDPAAVQAQCAQRGMASVCGFQEVSGCQCVQGQCRDIAGGAVAR